MIGGYHVNDLVSFIIITRCMRWEKAQWMTQRMEQSFVFYLLECLERRGTWFLKLLLPRSSACFFFHNSLKSMQASLHTLNINTENWLKTELKVSCRRWIDWYRIGAKQCSSSHCKKAVMLCRNFTLNWYSHVWHT